MGAGALPFSQAYRAGDFVFVSGQVAFGPDGKIVPGGIEAETRQTMANIQDRLAAAGCSLADVVKTTVWLANRDDFPAFNKVYGSYFPDNPPSRSTVESRLMIDAAIEIEAIAYRPLAN
ncbi:RidA family protein [Rhizobium sp. KVB221]|uniref:RidA family protein n=1 Tax=Rhizobium setariae TaxID=2801340 RepID=A0A936YRV1_9HYPH|nr:RidA family protein [Rhizobium setariae]MBL0373481.1 RidA family protein [Rhizobium setariae]